MRWTVFDSPNIKPENVGRWESSESIELMPGISAHIVRDNGTVEDRANGCEATSRWNVMDDEGEYLIFTLPCEDEDDIMRIIHDPQFNELWERARQEAEEEREFVARVQGNLGSFSRLDSLTPVSPTLRNIGK